MKPIVHIDKEKDNKLTFTLSGVSVSIANAIRRTLLSDIPTVVFKTAPYEENKAIFVVNTTRQNNEILKQRLSCVPIHINDLDMPLEKYLLEVDVENTTDAVQFVTTRDFKVKNIETNQFLQEKDNQKIFPPNEMTRQYIDFARLRPRISETIPGEKLHFTCEFSIATAKQDAMFNVVSTCSYGFTQDEALIETEIARRTKEWKEKGQDVDFETRNWRLLEAQRFVKKDSFDFVVETVGVFENRVLVTKACDILATRLKKTQEDVKEGHILISESESTMKNAYDMILLEEDYTLGKIVESVLFHTFYEDLKLLTYCGFKKMHPHDIQSILRVAYKEPTDVSTVRQHLYQVIVESIAVIEKIGEKF